MARYKDFPMDKKLFQAKWRYYWFITTIFAIIILMFAFTIFIHSIWIKGSRIAIIILIDLIILILLFYPAFLTIGYTNRIYIYNAIKHLIPYCQVFRVKKGLIKEYVIYQFPFYNKIKKMKINYLPPENYPSRGIASPWFFIITMNSNHPFDLDIWKWHSEHFITDNKLLWVFKLAIKDLGLFDRIQLDSRKKELKGIVISVERMPKIISIMIWILQELEKKPKLIKRRDFPNETPYFLGPRIYTACLHCGTIIGRWTRRDSKNVHKCPNCFFDTYVLLGKSKGHVYNKILRLKSKLKF